MNKPKRNRRNYIVKPKVGKKLIISTVASVMAVTLTASLLWNAMKISVPVEANTLSGVSEALKDHGSGEAFVILDIVPGTTDEELPLGTIGYLTSGQSQLEKYLAQAFIAGADGDFRKYDERLKKANELADMGISAFGGGYDYEESLTGGIGWTKIYDGEAVVVGKSPNGKEFEEIAPNLHRTVVKGTATHVGDGVGEYVKAKGLIVNPMMVKPASDNTEFSAVSISSLDLNAITGAFLLNEEGTIDNESIEEHDASDQRTVYAQNVDENGVITYEYIGTIGEIIDKRIKAREEFDAEQDRLEQEDLERQKREWLEKQEQNRKENNDVEGSDGNSSNDEQGQTTPADSPEQTEIKTTEEKLDTQYIPEASVIGVSTYGWMKFSSEGDGIDSAAAEGVVDDDPVDDNKDPGDDNKDPAVGGDDNDGPAVDDTKGDPVDNSENNLDDDLMEGFEPEKYIREEYEEEEFEYIIADFEYVRIASEEDLEDMEALYMPRYYSLIPDEEYEEAMSTFAVATLSEEPLSDNSVETTITDDCILVYVGAGKGDHAIAMGGKDAVDLLVYSAPTYFRCFDVDLLKKYVFDNSGLNIKINVKSAADVTIEDVKNADLIYLEDVPDRGKVNYISGGNDISEAAVYNIIDRVVNDLTPVIVDYRVSQGGVNKNQDINAEGMYIGTNYQKLASILLMTDLYSFVQDMDENVDDMLLNAATDEYGRKSNGDMHFVNNNIYVVNSQMSETLAHRESFTNAFGNISGFEEVKSAIDMENRQGNNLPDPSKAMAIQYIINYANSFIGEFRDFSILELQPTDGDSDLNTRNDSRNNTILYWRKPDSSGSGQQIVRSRKLIDITVDTESVAQFVGEQSDINDKYQMIFIGLDGQSLNYDGKDTAYNDSSLNGKVYSGVGDIADGAGQRYEGIDITSQKKNALLDFMQAGYPIVVENNFFVEKTAKDAGVSDINTDYIDESSQMYEFLRIALSSDDYKWCLYTIADVHTHYSDFAAQINVHRPSVEFDWGNAISELNVNEERLGQIVQTIAADAEGKYRGYIPYKVMDDEGDSYNNSVNTRFYLDMNQDGRFDELEEVTGDTAISNGVLIIEFAAPERGSIPWKLEISDESNSYRRDALTGYFKIAHSTQMPIRVVQVIGGITENSLDAKFNFELAYEMSDVSLLGYYLKKSETITNTKLEIKTMTVGQLAEEIKFNEEYLSGVDVLVLGFGPDCSLNVPVVDKNVEWYVNKYISEGRGVLVSSAASSESLGRMQLDVSAIGQKDIKTYSSLGRGKSSDVEFYKYSTLKSDMFDDWSLLSASKVNDGAISHYPYEVGSGVRLGDSVKIADYVLDLSSNGAPDTVADVTAWYCLGDMSYFDIETSYDVSKNDAANNYYIYSKGNLVYVGDNGYPYAYDSAATPDPVDNMQGTDNCKLLVNALMEAYSVGIKNPKVAIVAGLSDDSPEADSICIPYDEQIKEIEESEGVLDSNGVLDDTVDVYFKISEPNFAFRKDVTISFYYENNIAGVPVDIGGSIVNATQFASEVWTVDQNQLVPVNVGSGQDFVPGKIYMIKAPVVSLKDYDDTVKADIYIVVQSHFIKLGQDRHPIGSDSVTLNRAQLFLLE